MNLSNAEKQALYDLTVCTDRPNAQTAKLVKLGLAEQGAGKYGNYVRITAKGNALARSWSQDEQLHFMTQGLDIDQLTRHPPTPAKSSKKAAVAVPPSRAVSGTAAPAPVKPNAIRVTNGSKCTYYPMTTTAKLHGEIKRVRTSNKFFRAYNVGASSGDSEVC